MSISRDTEPLPSVKKSRLLGLVSWLLGLGIAGIGSSTVCGGMRQAIAQTTPPATVPFALVSTLADAEVRKTPGYRPRFSDMVGSGALMLNPDGDVTGYYFTISELDTNTTYAYHFHSDRSHGAPTSCEGDKSLAVGEAAGAVILDLGAIAPLRPTADGFGFVGSAAAPVELPSPIPLSEIGYLNIHPTANGTVAPGVICANIRLNAAGLTR